MMTRQGIVEDHRKRYGEELSLAERFLNAGYALVTNTAVMHPNGDAQAGRIMLGLYAKILNNLWSIIVLSELGLPTGSVTRELTEALINLATIGTDPTRMGQLYADGTALRAERDLNIWKNSREDRVAVTPEMEKLVQDRVAEIEARWGAEELKRMRSWRANWAEGKPVEQLVQEAKLPPIVYNGAYATDSRPTHAMDASDYLDIDEEENLQLLVPGRTINHLMPAMAFVLKAMEIVNRTFELKRDTTFEDLGKQLTKLHDRPARSGP